MAARSASTLSGTSPVDTTALAVHRLATGATGSSRADSRSRGDGRLSRLGLDRGSGLHSLGGVGEGQQGSPRGGNLHGDLSVGGGAGAGGSSDRGAAGLSDLGVGVNTGHGSSAGGGGSGGGSGSDGAGAANDGSAGGGDSGGSLGDGDGAAVGSRAGDGVSGQGGVDVDEDAILSGSVELGTLDTGGSGSTGTGDLEVEALGVVLGAILLLSAVESDELVTEDVVAGGDGGRDLDHPAVVVVDQLVSTPGAGDLGVADETDTVDLEELQIGLVDGLAAAVAARQVVQDGTVVGVGPGGPLDVDLLTGTDDNVGLGVCGVLVADDVRVAVGIGRDETVAGVGGRPGGDLRGVGLVGEDADVETLVVDTVDDEVGDVTVGSDLGGRQKGREERGRLSLTHDC